MLRVILITTNAQKFWNLAMLMLSNAIAKQCYCKAMLILSIDKQCLCYAILMWSNVNAKQC